MAQTLQTLNAMNTDARLIMVRERYITTFWILLTTGIGVFTISKIIK
jgi:hypothetical protein